jgi:DNA polymerase III subunit beta
MNITANASTLAGALALAVELSDDKHNKKVAALEAVVLRAADGALTVSANVLDHALALTVPAEIESAGEIAVSGARLHKLTTGFPAATSLQIRAEGSIALISAGRSRFQLPIIDLNFMPPSPAIAQATGSTELAREEMLALLRPRCAAATEVVRGHLCGLLLHDTAAGLTACATDGYQLARAIIPGASLSSDRSLVVPLVSLDIVAKLLRDKNIERVGLRRSKTLIEIKTTKATFVSKLIDAGDAGYPAYERVVPVPSSNSITVNRSELASALNRVAAVVDHEARTAPLVGLQWSAGELALHLCIPGHPTLADDVLDATAASGNGKTALQIRMLSGLLDELTGATVAIDTNGHPGPTLINDPLDSDFLSLLMPCAWPLERAAAA